MAPLHVATLTVHLNYEVWPWWLLHYLIMEGIVFNEDRLITTSLWLKLHGVTPCYIHHTSLYTIYQSPKALTSWESLRLQVDHILPPYSLVASRCMDQMDGRLVSLLHTLMEQLTPRGTQGWRHRQLNQQARGIGWWITQGLYIGMKSLTSNTSTEEPALLLMIWDPHLQQKAGQSDHIQSFDSTTS